jgi:hypothetical protein
MHNAEQPSPPLAEPGVPARAGEPPPPLLPLLAAADLQDHLMAATMDLERLQGLLDDASATLMGHFYGATQHLNGLARAAAGTPALDTRALHEALQTLSGAVTALQFQDMASQLIVHTRTRLRSCADQLARDVMGDDEDGMAVVSAPPLRPNPVTQDEMDAGSVELF